MHYKIIAKLVRDKKKSLNITQNDLAEITGIGLRTIKNIESGKGNPTLNTLNKIFEALGMELIVRSVKVNIKPGMIKDA
ncbi:MAG: helix-turn-helix transcriptional regulator [Ignavibacteria bacterium]|nr:helix-turn-helix transcriptional regulator [Ignavibacteria bacterium]